MLRFGWKNMKKVDSSFLDRQCKLLINIQNVQLIDNFVLYVLKPYNGHLYVISYIYSICSKDEDLEQLDKLAKLIRDLKAQEKAYVDFVKKSIVSLVIFHRMVKHVFVFLM